MKNETNFIGCFLCTKNVVLGGPEVPPQWGWENPRLRTQEVTKGITTITDNKVGGVIRTPLRWLKISA